MISCSEAIRSFTGQSTLGWEKIRSDCNAIDFVTGRSSWGSGFVLTKNKVNRSHCIINLHCYGGRTESSLELLWILICIQCHLITLRRRWKKEWEQPPEAPGDGDLQVWVCTKCQLGQDTNNMCFCNLCLHISGVFFWYDVSNFIAKNWISCSATNQTCCLHFEHFKVNLGDLSDQ